MVLFLLLGNKMSCLYVILNGMQWTDRIRQVKILLVISAIVIAVVSLLVSHYLVRDLQRQGFVKTGISLLSVTALCALCLLWVGML